MVQIPAGVREGAIWFVATVWFGCFIYKLDQILDVLKDIRQALWDPPKRD